MNKAFFIGNLTRDPELRTLPSGDSVCSFTIAVNRRRRASAEAGQPEADFIRITAWRQLGENCSRFLAKGRKVGVVGTVSASAYMAKDGTARAQLELNADDVEFLTPRGEQGDAPAAPQPASFGSAPAGGSYVQVDDEELPF